MAVSEAELIAEMDQFFREARFRNHCVRILYGDSRCAAWGAVLDKNCFLPIADLKDVALSVGTPTLGRHIIRANKK